MSESSEFRIGRWVVRGWKADVLFMAAIGVIFLAGFVLGLSAGGPNA